MAENKTINLLDLWKKDKNTVEEEALVASLDELRVDGEQTLLGKKTGVRNAKNKLKKALEAGKTGPNFNEVHMSRLNVERAEMELDEVVNTYKSIFEDDPKFL